MCCAYWQLVMLSRIIQGYASMDSDGKAVRLTLDYKRVANLLDMVDMTAF
jgi:hypothetical protein